MVMYTYICMYIVLCYHVTFSRNIRAPTQTHASYHLCVYSTTVSSSTPLPHPFFYKKHILCDLTPSLSSDGYFYPSPPPLRPPPLPVVIQVASQLHRQRLIHHEKVDHRGGDPTAVKIQSIYRVFRKNYVFQNPLQPIPSSTYHCKRLSKFSKSAQSLLLAGHFLYNQ